MTKRFSFQIQFSPQILSDTEIVDTIAEAIKQAGGQITDETSGNDDNTRFVNLYVYSENPREFWPRVRQNLESYGGDSTLLAMMIVVCQGDQGWDDYLLLHHYDKNQKTDVLT
jgi:hypothetical protein